MQLISSTRSDLNERISAVGMLGLIPFVPQAFLLGGGRGVTPTTPRPSAVTMKLADDGILGVGVIGAGRIGLVHLEALSQCESARAVM